MRSICSSGMLSKLAWPVVAEPMRTPSTNSSTWRLSVPRMKMLEFLPRPPLAAICTPAMRASSSGTVRPVLFSIASRSITVTSLSTAEARDSRRVAVTTVSDSEVCEWAGNAAAKARGSARGRTRRMR